MVIDATDAPLLASVSDEKGERIAVRELQLDSFDVAQETFAQEPVDRSDNESGFVPSRANG